MFFNRIFKWTVFSVVLLAFGLDSGHLLREENSSCMGVQILTEVQASVFTEERQEDLSEILLYNGEPAAIDTATSTVYLSQSIRENSRPKDLPGELSVSDKSYRLYFAPDERFSDLHGAMAEGHGFRLLLTTGDSRCVTYRVVFTSLPVLRLDGNYAYTDEEKRPVRQGELCLWTPEDPETGRFSTKSSGLEWKVRANGVEGLSKVSWKLSLRDELGENNDLDFLGLGADDDWILNSLRMDDTKLKEHLFMQLWNQWADKSVWNVPMSTGEHVEVVCNGDYCGVYLLQRRLDRKYYQLDEDDILIKGINWFTTDIQEEAYEIIYSPLSDQETMALMSSILDRTDCSRFQLDNFLDVNLFLQYAVAVDNCGVKNTYYLLTRQEGDYCLSMIPWDTDLSWGVIWTNHYDYVYERAMNLWPERREFEAVSRYFPELPILMSFRWEEMRASIFSDENVRSLLEESSGALLGSGALTRDQERWGVNFGGKDSVENLFRFTEERLRRMDGRYLN